MSWQARYTSNALSALFQNPIRVPWIWNASQTLGKLEIPSPLPTPITGQKVSWIILDNFGNSFAPNFIYDVRYRMPIHSLNSSHTDPRWREGNSATCRFWGRSNGCSWLSEFDKLCVLQAKLLVRKQLSASGVIAPRPSSRDLPPDSTGAFHLPDPKPLNHKCSTRHLQCEQTN